MPARATKSPTEGFARQETSRLRSWMLGSVMAVLVLAGAVAGLGLISGAHWLEPTALPGLSLADRTAAAAGLRPVRFEVQGHRFTSLADIDAALDLASAHSQISFDPLVARRRIEALPWVKAAKVARILPDAVAVEIEERRPAIAWRSGERDILVDMQGRELASVPRNSALGLPVVMGEGAGTAAPELVAIVDAHPEVERRVVEARRVEGRRWTLQLASGTLLHLPGDGMAAAFAWIEAQAASGLLDRGLEAIDLRVAGQLVIRPRSDRLAANPAEARSAGRTFAAGGPP